MDSMQRLLFLLAFSGALVCGQSLSGVHSVYLLPMSRGLDQYLANRLTNQRVFQVVTDSRLADAVFTDRLGSAFENKLADLFPKPASPAAGKESADKNEPEPAASGPADTANKLADPAANSSFGRSKGMVFLVDPKSRHVLWSVFQPPRDSSSGQLDRIASDIVSRLKRDLGEK